MRATKLQDGTQEQATEAASTSSVGDGGFKNRTSKKCITDRVKEMLPSSPKKKATVVATLANSPKTRKILAKHGLHKTPEEQKELSTLRALAAHISEGLNEVQGSGSNEKRAAVKAFTSLAFGENMKKTRARKSLGKLVNLNERSISKVIRNRESILN